VNNADQIAAGEKPAFVVFEWLEHRSLAGWFCYIYVAVVLLVVTCDKTCFNAKPLCHTNVAETTD
jgi:hypothetical protein